VGLPWGFWERRTTCLYLMGKPRNKGLEFDDDND
jgi:hypothetical protein